MTTLPPQPPKHPIAHYREGEDKPFLMHGKTKFWNSCAATHCPEPVKGGVQCTIEFPDKTIGITMILTCAKHSLDVIKATIDYKDEPVPVDVFEKLLRPGGHAG